MLAKCQKYIGEELVNLFIDFNFLEKFEILADTLYGISVKIGLGQKVNSKYAIY